MTTRDEAILILAVCASNPRHLNVAVDLGTSNAARHLALSASIAADHRRWPAWRIYAEAEALLQTGWTP